MAADLGTPTSFDRIVPPGPLGPLVIAVPHAGRDYPAALLANARLPQSRLQALEDRLIDEVVTAADLSTCAAFVARRARAWIDLNRDPRELDREMISPPPGADAVLATSKVRGGLGLVPRRVAGAGEIHARKLPLAEIGARIAADHAPYHAAIDRELRRARATYGVALLVDCHSMPAVPPVSGGSRPRVVIGDRFGRSADPRFSDIAMASAEGAGFSPALNVPYAGGYTLDRHGRPEDAIHAIQIEIDRSLYLDPAMERAGPGLAHVARWLGTLVAALTGACGIDAPALAAE